MSFLGWAEFSVNYNGLHTLPAVGPLILGSSVYNVSVPGLVADTHNLNKIDIKNYTFMTNGENHITWFGFT